MKLTTSRREPNEYGEGEAFEINLRTKEGEKGFVVSDNMEPEDVMLGRDLGFVFNIPAMLKMAYEAGKRGEDLAEAEVPYEED